jgi:23S rRNA (uracil1939-C5)-methyltransferase
MSLIGKEITLSIDRLAGLGEGCGQWEGRKVFVPYSLAGERVKAVITQETQEFLRAKPVSIEIPSAGRAPAPCPHFMACGGCSLQHLGSAAYSAFKQKTLEEALRKAGFPECRPEPLIPVAPDSRRRVEWSVQERNGEIELGFLEGRSHALVDIRECRVLVPQLQQLIHPLRAALKKLQLGGAVASVQALYLHPLLDIGIVLHGKYSASLENPLLALGNALGAARLSVLLADSPKILMQKRPVQRRVDAMNIELPPFCFLQAGEEAERRMIDETMRGLHGCRRIADLFCGVGTYSIPLTLHAQVKAFDAVSWMTDALNHAAAQHEIHRQLGALRRDLFRSPLKASELSAFDGVVINPPREGAKAQCAEIARSGVPKLVMLSCNPATFTRDAAILREGGYTLTRALGIDQFVYSPHLEIVAHFTKSS